MVAQPQNEMLRAAVDAWPDPVWSWSSTGTLLFANRTWQLYAGPEASDRPDSWWDALHADDRPSVQAEWARRVEARTAWRTTARLLRRDGEHRWFELHVWPEADAVDRWTGIGCDVDESHRERQALAVERERLARIADVAPVALHAFRIGPHGEASFPYASERLGEIYGFASEQLSETAEIVRPLMHPDDRGPAFETIAESARNLTPWRGQFRYNHPLRGQIWIQVHSAPVREADGGTVWYGILEDVTARKRGESSLEEAQRQLRRAYDAAELGTWRHDIATGMVMFDARGLAHDGSTADPVPITEVVGRMHPDDRERVAREIAQTTGPAGDGRYTTEYRIIHPDGRVRWLAVQARVDFSDTTEGRVAVEGFGTSQDVTPRKNAERALRFSEARYRSLVELAPDAVIVNGENRIAFVNQEAVRLFRAKSEDELIGGSPFDLFEPDFHQTLAARIRAILGGQSLPAWTARIRALDGSTRDVEAVAGLVPDDEAPSIQVVLRDITDRRRDDERRDRAQKLQAIGTLASGIAHDFNDILLAITGNATMAANELAPNHPVQASLRDIATAAHRAADLVRRILAFSRPHERRHETVQLSTVLDETLKFMRATIPATIEMQQHVEANLPLVEGDPTQLQQVVINLLTNAAQAIGLRTGTIVLRLEHAPAAASDGDAQSAPPSHGSIRLTVTDSGCGMDPETQRRMFDPFFTTKPPGEGAGLGLSVVHGIVTSHQGAIAVDSRVGGGTTFVLTFPARSPPAASVAGPVDSVPRGAGERVLYIDDEEVVVRVAVRMLQHLGYRTVGHSDVATAIAAFAAAPADIDLVVTDLSMPRFSGLDVIRELRALRPDVRIIVTTGYATAEMREAASRMGADGLIAKPHALSELARIVRHVLDRVDEGRYRGAGA